MRFAANAWQTLPIASCCELVTSGGTPSRKRLDYYHKGTIPWVKTGELTDWYVRPSDISERITEDGVRNSSAKLYPKGTILVAMYGDGRTIGSLGIVDEPVASNQACCALIPDQGVCTPEFLFYTLMHRRSELIALALGGAQRNLSGTTIKRFEIQVPPLALQGKIASLLSAYDELIDNKTRKIAILEEMGQRIYAEWFVHFRAPNCEGLPLIDSPLGSIPQGWQIETLASVAAVNPEQINLKQPPQRIGYIDIASVSPGRIEQVTPMDFVDAPGRARRIVRAGDIIWSCVRPNRRSYAFIQEPGEDWIASTGFAVLRPNPHLAAYFYHAVTTDGFVDFLVGRATGAAYPAVTAGTFESARLVVPPSEILKSFDNIVAPMMRLANLLHRQCDILRAQRNLLLPKLISGEIDLSEAEVLLEAAE